MTPQTTYYLMRGGVSLFYNLWLTVTLLYHATLVTTDPFLLLMLGVAHEATTFLFEIPTGVFADSYSRKWSVIIGCILSGVAYILEGLFPIYLTVLLAQVLFGVGFTFQSGANDAWLADEVGPEHAAPIFIRGTQISQIMAQVGILSAILIGQSGLQNPLIVAGVGMIGMGLILVRAMTETGFRPERVSESVLAQMQQTFQKSLLLVRLNRRFVSVVSVGFVVGLSLGGYDRLFTPHFVQNFHLPLEPIVWLGLLSAVVAFSSALVLQWMRGRAKLMSAERIPGAIAWLYAGTLLGNIIFVLAGQFGLAVFAYWFSQMLRATTRPLIIVWINQIAESRVRATAISMYWQSNALGHIIGMPVIGLIGSLTSLRVALMTSVLAHSPVLWLLTRRQATIDPAQNTSS